MASRITGQLRVARAEGSIDAAAERLKEATRVHDAAIRSLSRARGAADTERLAQLTRRPPTRKMAEATARTRAIVAYDRSQSAIENFLSLEGMSENLSFNELVDCVAIEEVKKTFKKLSSKQRISLFKKYWNLYKTNNAYMNSYLETVE